MLLVFLSLVEYAIILRRIVIFTRETNRVNKRNEEIKKNRSNGNNSEYNKRAPPVSRILWDEDENGPPCIHQTELSHTHHRGPSVPSHLDHATTREGHTHQMDCFLHRQ